MGKFRKDFILPEVMQTIEFTTFEVTMTRDGILPR
jgi:hypothetical protein